MPANVASLQATISWDLTKLKSGASEASGAIKQVADDADTHAGRTNKALGSVGDAAGGLGSKIKDGLAVAGGFLALQAGISGVHDAFTTTIGAATDWQTKLNEIQGNTTFTNADMVEMKRTIQDMASTSDASLGGLADGFMHAGNLGFNLADSQKIVSEAMKSAQSTGGDLSTVINVLAQGLKEFNLTGDQSAHVMNTYHQAAAEGNMTLEQFAESSGRAMANAAAYGAGLTDTAAAMSALTSHGRDAATAGTEVAAMLDHMIKPSASASAELERLTKLTGIDLVGDFSEAGLKAKGLSGVLADVAAATHGDANEMMQLIPATRGGRAEVLLATTAAADYHRILGDLNDTMSGKLDPTTAAYTRTQQTLGFQFGELKNNLSLAGIAIGEKLLPPLTQLVGIGAKGLIWITDGSFSNALKRLIPPEVLDAGKTFFGFFEGPAVAGIGTVVTELIAFAIAVSIVEKVTAVTAAVTGLAEAFVAMSSAESVSAALMAVAGGPFTLIAIGIGLLVAAIVLLVTHWGDLEKRFPILQKLTTDVEHAFHSFLGVVESLGTAIAGLDIGGKLTTGWQAMKTAAESAATFLLALPGQIGSALSTLGSAIGTFFTQTLPDFFTKTVPKALDALPGLLVDGIKAAAFALGEAAALAFIVLPEKLGQAGIDAVKALGDGLSRLADVVASAFGAAWAWITSDRGPVSWPEKILRFFSTLGTDLLDLLDKACSLALKAFVAAWDWISGDDGPRTWPLRIVHFFDSLGSDILAKLGEFVSGLVEGFGNAWKWITGADGPKSWPGAIVHFFDSMYDDFVGIGGKIVSGLAAGLKDFAHEIGKPIEAGIDIIDAFISGMNTILQKFNVGSLPALPKLPGFAAGGSVDRDQFAWVGERGPEVVMLPRGAEVIPNHMLQGFEGGTSGALDALKSFAGTVTNDIKALVSEGASAVVNAIPLPKMSGGSVVDDLINGSMGMLKDAALSFVKGLFQQAQATIDAASGGGNAILDKAEHTPGQYLWCEKFVGDVLTSLGFDYFRAPSASAHSRMQPLKHDTPPPGAVVFYPASTEDGHVNFAGPNGTSYGTVQGGTGWSPAGAFGPMSGWTDMPANVTKSILAVATSAAATVGGSLSQWIQAAVSAEHAPSSFIAGFQKLIMNESGGSPTANSADNPKDPNTIAGNPTIGLTQNLPDNNIAGTFGQNHIGGWPAPLYSGGTPRRFGFDLLDPVQNIEAAIHYILGRYGPNFDFHSPYANGGWVTEPVYGVGAVSGHSYSFAENGSEYVSRNGAGGGGDTYHAHFAPGSVVIPVKDLQDIRDVKDFFDRLPQAARAARGR